MKDNNKIITMIALVCLISLFMIGLWAIDLGASSAIISAQTGNEIITQSLFSVRDANTQYHLGMFMSILTMLIISTLLIYNLIESNKGVELNDN